jgi:hypothetical protein
MKIIVLIRDAFLFSSFDTKGDVGHQFVSVVHFSVHLTQKVMFVSVVHFSHLNLLL